MLVCVDHGNKQIKTASRVFTSGLVESDTRPPFGDNILFYRGKYYTLSDQRIPYTRDKTEDDRFFILTLFAIAYEINAAGQYVPDRLMNIQLAVGLPPAHYGTQYKRFAQYFLNRGVIGFEFNGRKYSICITEAVCFPQALAATSGVQAAPARHGCQGHCDRHRRFYCRLPLPALWRSRLGFLRFAGKRRHYAL